MKINDVLNNPRSFYKTWFGNSSAQTYDLIVQEESIHPLCGLRKCELIIDDASSAIKYGKSQIEKTKARIEFLEENVCFLESFYNFVYLIPIIRTWIKSRIAEYKAEIDNLTYETTLEKIKVQIDDRERELKIALKERDRIISEHPEYSEKSPEELQELSFIALKERKAHEIAFRIWSRYHGLPDAAGDLIVGSTLEDQKFIVLRVSQILQKTEFFVRKADIFGGFISDSNLEIPSNELDKFR